MINEHIIRRWIRIICLSVWGPLLLFVITLTSERIGSFVTIISKDPLWFSLVCLAFMLTVLLVPLLRVTPISWAQFRFFHRYPTVWIAGVFGLVSIWALNSQLGIGPPFLSTTLQWGAILLVSALAFALPYVRFISDSTHNANKARAPQSEPCISRFTDISSDWKAFGKWVSNDNPITRSEQDLFEMYAIARRMARLFRERDSAGCGISAGLVGPLGSGKTSIVNLIKRELAKAPGAKDPHVWVCEISCWGFNSSAAALQHVLSEIVKTIGEYVDCSGLRGMPEAYRHALTGGNDSMRLLGGLFGGERDPGVQLGRLTPILRAVNARLLIVLEDVDRNQSPTFNCDDITSMLFRLKTVKEVSFILAASSQSRIRIDFAKICDHIEIVPSPKQEAVLNSFGVIRKHCLEDYDFIDPARSSARSNAGLELWHGDSQIWLSELPSFPDAISLLVSTPRNLKHVFRNILAFWKELYGEVDIDELMVVSILRHCAPEGFEFLRENLGLLRQEPLHGNDPTDRQRALKQEWEKLTESVEWDQRAAMDLILFLIPNAQRFLTERRRLFGDSLPQTIALTSPTDYWPRMVRGSLSETEVSDQEVLRQIDDWRRSDANSPALAQYLYEHENSVRVWEHLQESFETPELLKLADFLFEILLRKEGPSASAENMAALGVWRRANRHLSTTPSNAEWLANNMTRALPVSLEMGVSLYYYWASPQHGIVDRAGRDGCRQALVEEFRALMQRVGAEGLIKILHKDHPFALLRLVFPPDHQAESPSVLSEPGDWQWFAPVILSAAEHSPQQIVPPLACLVCKSQYAAAANAPIFVYGLDLDHATGIFGQNLRRLMECLTKEVLVEDKSCDEVVAAVRSDARAWLNSNP
jgi:hypothetical protein